MSRWTDLQTDEQYQRDQMLRRIGQMMKTKSFTARRSGDRTLTGLQRAADDGLDALALKWVLEELDPTGVMLEVYGEHMAAE